MTEVESPNSNVLGTYTYTSAPRPINHLGSSGNSKTSRSIRTTNFNKDNIPKWNPYFAYARSLSRSDMQLYETEEVKARRSEFRRKMQERAKLRRENLGISSLYPSKGAAVIIKGSTVRRVNPRHTIAQTLYDRRKLSTALAEERQRTQLDSTLHTKQLVTVGTQVFEEDLQPKLKGEEAVVFALATNIIREAALEIAMEAETDRAKMIQLAGAIESSSVYEKNHSDSQGNELRVEPEGEEAKPENENVNIESANVESKMEEERPMTVEVKSRGSSGRTVDERDGRHSAEEAEEYSEDEENGSDEEVGNQSGGERSDFEEEEADEPTDKTPTLE